MADGEDNIHLSSRNIELHESFIISESSRNNLRTFLSKPFLQQSAYFYDKVLEHLRFHLLHFFVVFVIFDLLWLFKRSLSKSLNDVNDLLDRQNNDDIDIIGERK